MEWLSHSIFTSEQANMIPYLQSKTKTLQLAVETDSSRRAANHSLDYLGFRATRSRPFPFCSSGLPNFPIFNARLVRDLRMLHGTATRVRVCSLV